MLSLARALAKAKPERGDEPAMEVPKRSAWSSSLFSYFQPSNSFHLGVGVTASLCSAAIKTYLTILLGQIFAVIAKYGQGHVSGDYALLEASHLCGILAGLGGIHWLASLASIFSWQYLGEVQLRCATDKLFDALTRREMGWFDMQHDGLSSIVVRLQAQLIDLKRAWSTSLGRLVEVATMSFANIVVAFYFSWSLALVILSTAPVAVITLQYINSGTKSIIDSESRELQRANKHATAVLEAADIIRVYDSIDHEIWSYAAILKRYVSHQMRLARRYAATVSLTKLWVDCLFVLGFYYGCVLVNHGADPGHIATTFLATLGALEMLESLAPTYVLLKNGTVAADALTDSTDPDKPGRDLSAPSFHSKQFVCRSGVRLHNVNFAYPSSPMVDVLRDISLHFSAGQITFVVGRSGSGKSTIGNLLTRMYEPSAGHISIDEHPLNTLDPAWVRRNVLLVEQPTIPLHDAFLDGFGAKSQPGNKETTDLSDYWQAFIATGGSKLSQGQKQRLVLSRALFQAPEILILDEMTSAIDPISAELTMTTIRQLRKGKTTIIVTHDLDQIKDKDLVHVVEGGQVVQSGFRRDLMCDDRGLFARLITTLHQPRGHSTPVNSDHAKEKSSNAMSPLIIDGCNPDRPPVLRPLVVNSVPRTRHFAPFSRLRGQDLTRNEPQNTRAERRNSSSPHEQGSILLKVLSSCYCFARPAGAKGSNEEISSLAAIYCSIWINLAAQEKFHLVAGISACVAFAGTVPVFSFVLAKLMSILWTPDDRLARGQTWALFLLMVAVIGATSSFVSHYILDHISCVWISNLRRKALLRTLQQRTLWIDSSTHRSTEVVADLDGKAEVMRFLVARIAPMILIVCVLVLATLTWAFVVSWRMTLIGIAGMLALLVSAHLFSVASHRHELRCMQAEVDTGNIMMYTISHIRDIRLWSLESVFCDAHQAAVTKAMAIGVERCISTSFFAAFPQSLTLFSMALILYYAAVLLGKQRTISAEAAMQVINLLSMGLLAASNILSSLPNIASAQAAASRLLRHANSPLPSPGQRPSTSGRESLTQGTWRDACQRGQGKNLVTLLPIQLSALSFSYLRPAHSLKDATTPTLQGVTFEIVPGAVTAIVGPPGSGKSTILSLLLGLRSLPYMPAVLNTRPSSCRYPLTYAGVPSHLVAPESLRAHIGYLPHTAYIFPGTVAGNITYGLAEDSKLRLLTRVERVTRHLGIHEWISSMPEGFETRIGEGGQKLSSGQAQGLCIARALVRRPSLLVLDEPTASMDAESASSVRSALDHLINAGKGVERPSRGSASLRSDRRQRTVTIIAATHSREMMRWADRVIFMDQGRVVSIGSYRELMSRCRSFGDFIAGSV